MNRTLLLLLAAAFALPARAQETAVSGSGAGTTRTATTSATVLVGQPAIGAAGTDATAAGLGVWSVYRYRGMVPVELSSFTLAWEGSGIALAWEVAGEPRDHAGFHVYRAVGAEERRRLTRQLLQGEVRYRFLDPAPPPGEVSYWLAEVARTGGVTWYGPLTVEVSAGPRPRLALLPNVPNPFAGRTVIGFQVPVDGPVRLRVHDAQGRLVARLVEGSLVAGVYEAAWNGRTDAGRPAAAGVYLYRLETAEGTRVRKLILAR